MQTRAEKTRNSLAADIRRVNDYSEEDQVATVKNHSYLLAHIDSPSESVQLAAVRHNGNAIKYIEKPSLKVQRAAIKKTPSALRSIENPSKDIIKYAFNERPTLIYFLDKKKITLEIARIAMSMRYHCSLQLLGWLQTSTLADNQGALPLELQIKFAKTSLSFLKSFARPSKEVILFSLAKYFSMSPTHKILLNIIYNDPKALSAGTVNFLDWCTQELKK